MARSPERISPFLRSLQALWERYPDQRFGQLVMNLSRTEDGFADTWEWEDGSWLSRIDEMFQRTWESDIQGEDS